MAISNLVPIRVKIRYGDRGNGKTGYLYPDLDQVSSTIRKGLRWQEYIDRYGSGWFYDNENNIGDTDAYNSDPDVRYGMMLVPEAFADAAKTAFPTEVEELTEPQVEEFIDTRAMTKHEDIIRDPAALTEIQIKQQRGTAQDLIDVNKALDPDDDTPGLKKNPIKTWDRVRQKKGYTLHSRVPKKSRG